MIQKDENEKTDFKYWTITKRMLVYVLIFLLNTDAET